MNHPPKVSIVLPVHNAAPYLAQCIDSLLGQTLSDFELVIINDGSTDDSAEVIATYQRQDPRIRFINHQQNRGLVAVLNSATALCQGKYIARMDADDWCEPERLALQCDVLDSQPDISVVGSWIALFGARQEVWHYRMQDEFIKALLLFRTNAMPHNSLIAKRECLERFQYDPAYIHVEDAELWSRMMMQAPEVRFANIPRVLTHYRIHHNQVSEQHKDIQQQQFCRIIRKLLENLLGSVSSHDWQCHWALIDNTTPPPPLSDVANWVNRLLGAYRERYGDGAFAIEEKWLNHCRHRGEPHYARAAVDMPSHFYFLKEAP